MILVPPPKGATRRLPQTNDVLSAMCHDVRLKSLKGDPPDVATSELSNSMRGEANGLHDTDDALGRDVRKYPNLGCPSPKKEAVSFNTAFPSV